MERIPTSLRSLRAQPGRARSMPARRWWPLVTAALVLGLLTLTGGRAEAQAFSCSVSNNADGSATVTWNNIGANGYDVIEDNQPKRWVRTTSTRDFSPGTNYRVVAFGNGTNFTTATCTNATPGGGPGFSCTVTNNANGSVTVNWNNICLLYTSPSPRDS